MLRIDCVTNKLQEMSFYINPTSFIKIISMIKIRVYMMYDFFYIYKIINVY